MKNNLRMILACAVFGVIFGCAANSYAQVVGGYKIVAVDDATVGEAADAAVVVQSEEDKTTYTLVAVKSAARQVVQGTNYKLCLQVSGTDEQSEIEYVKFAQVVVFYSLQKEFELKSWTETKNCRK